MDDKNKVKESEVVEDQAEVKNKIGSTKEQVLYI